MVPAELGQIIRRYLSGDRAGAVRAWEDLLPLIHFENRQCGLRAQKILLARAASSPRSGPARRWAGVAQDPPRPD